MALAPLSFSPSCSLSLCPYLCLSLPLSLCLPLSLSLSPSLSLSLSALRRAPRSQPRNAHTTETNESRVDARVTCSACSRRRPLATCLPVCRGARFSRNALVPSTRSLASPVRPKTNHGARRANTERHKRSAVSQDRSAAPHSTQLPPPLPPPSRGTAAPSPTRGLVHLRPRPTACGTRAARHAQTSQVTLARLRLHLRPSCGVAPHLLREPHGGRAGCAAPTSQQLECDNRKRSWRKIIALIEEQRSHDPPQARSSRTSQQSKIVPAQLFNRTRRCGCALARSPALQSDRNVLGACCTAWSLPLLNEYPSAFFAAPNERARTIQATHPTAR